jgi:hypothetical protein
MSFGIGEGGFAYIVPFVIGLGTTAAGAIGTVTELAVKQIDKEKKPILRAVGEIFAKSLQTGAAALTLVMIGSLVTNPIGLGTLYGIGVILLLTPIVNGIIQHTTYDSLKKGFNIADQAASIVAKTINTATLATAVWMSLGIPAAILGGISLTTLNIVTYMKA